MSETRAEQIGRLRHLARQSVGRATYAVHVDRVKSNLLDAEACEAGASALETLDKAEAAQAMGGEHAKV